MEAGCKRARSLGELASQGALGDDNTAVDAGRCRPGLLAGLESHIVQQGRLGECGFGNRVGVVNLGAPAAALPQVEGVATERRFGQTANPLAVQVAIEPSHLAARFVLDNMKRASCLVQTVLMNEMEGHGRAASNRS